MASLSPREFVEILSRAPEASAEHVILVHPRRKTLRIRQADWERHFAGWAGMALHCGQEIAVRPAHEGGNRLSLPSWAVEQLALAKDDRLCITSREEGLYLKRLRLEALGMGIPGTIVIDAFGDREVIRRHAINSDITHITGKALEALLSEMGHLRYDPLAPLRQASGWIGLAARRDVGGRHDPGDRETRLRYQAMTAEGQDDDGSWEGNVVRTSFNAIRLIELGCAPTEGHVA
jgi:hypothetical protein